MVNLADSQLTLQANPGGGRKWATIMFSPQSKNLHKPTPTQANTENIQPHTESSVMQAKSLQIL